MKFFLEHYFKKAVRTFPRKALAMILVISVFSFPILGFSLGAVLTILKLFAFGYIFTTLLTAALLGYLISLMAKDHKVAIEDIVEAMYVDGHKISDIQWYLFSRKSKEE